jgi:hypothetical protein
MDEVAVAAAEADEDRIDLLAQPDSATISSLWEDLRWLARSANRTPRDCFSAARAIRIQALGLAERTRRPSSLADLYLIAGASTALMASSAFDLHRWDKSERLSLSAISYGEVTGNHSLLTWTTGPASLLANWRNEPDAALRYFRQGAEIAPPGMPRLRLRYIAARSYALLGDVAAVRQIVDDAETDHDDSSRCDLMSGELGGEFAFGAPRAAACIAAAWLDLGQGQEAADSAQRALEELTALPAGRQPSSQITGARIDLATALERAYPSGRKARHTPAEGGGVPAGADCSLEHGIPDEAGTTQTQHAHVDHPSTYLAALLAERGQAKTLANSPSATRPGVLAAASAGRGADVATEPRMSACFY